jgi:hypothetical protein
MANYVNAPNQVCVDLSVGMNSTLDAGRQGVRPCR